MTIPAMSDRASLHSRNFYALNAGYFLVSSTLAVFFVFNPFLSDRGIDNTYAGILIGIFNLSSIIFRLLAAPFLNGKGRIFLCMGASAVLMSISLLLYIAEHSLTSLLILRALNGIAFAGLFSSVNALCPYFIPQGKSGTAFSIISVSTLLPYVLIPPLSGVLFTGEAQNSNMIASAAFLSVLFLPLIMILKKGNRPEVPSLQNKNLSLSEICRMLRNFSMLAAMLTVLLFYAGYAAIFYFLDQFGKAHGMTNPGIFFSLAIASSIAVRFAGFRIFDKLCKFKLGAIAFILLAPVIFLTDLLNPVHLNLLACAYGLCWGIIIPMLFAIPYDLADEKNKGLAVNFAAAMLDGGFIAGPLLGSFLLAHGSWMLFFTVFAILSLAAGILLFLAPPLKDGEHRGKTF